MRKKTGAARVAPLESGLLIEWRLAGDKGWAGRRMALVTQTIPDPAGSPHPIAFVAAVRGGVRVVTK